MRTLFLLRGIPASGKTSWIQQNNLEPYTLSTDGIRLLYQSPVTTNDGEFAISQDNDKAVWDLLYDLLERRMEKGEFVIVDATHYKLSILSKYKDYISKYRYRAYVVDFSGVSKEECIRRNAERGFRKVPEAVIDKMYEAITTDNEIQKKFKVISPDEAVEMINKPLEPFEVPYEKVVVFGDIHGCYEPLKEYFEKNPFDENVNYIFTGDYIDRGLQNKEVLEFLLSLKEKQNCIFLEGNHCKWLRIYASKEYHIEDYLKGFEYKDPYVVKVVAQLKEKVSQLEKRLEKNRKKADAISDMLKKSWETNPDNQEVYYEFELINVPATHKALGTENENIKAQIEKLNRLIAVMQHEEHNTKSILKDTKKWYDETFGELNLDISSVLENKFAARSLKKDNPIKSAEFLKNTYPQIESIDKANLRRFCDKLAQLSYIKFNGKKFLITHGGVPCMPCIKTSTREIIHGTGAYADHEQIDNTFLENVSDVIQIHGHRNVMNSPLLSEDINRPIINLEGKIEEGGYLRIVELVKDSNEVKIVPIEIKNNLYKHEEVVEEKEKTDIEVLREMYLSDLINVKEQEDNIVSFNFNKDAFFNDKWNKLSCTARGLFVDKTNGTVVAKSFSKFFNHCQRPETRMPALKQNLVFPLRGYRKENGFLGLISKYKGKLHFFTKSMMDTGDFYNLFVGVLCEWYGITCEWNGLKEGQNHVANYNDVYHEVMQANDHIYNHKQEQREQNKPYDAKFLKEQEDIIKTCTEICKGLKDKLVEYLYDKITEGYTYVFETVENTYDPHMIKYERNMPVLLEVFTNKLQEEKVDYDDLIRISDGLGIPVKSHDLDFDTWEDFESWVKSFTETDKYACRHEGYVIEDAAGFRVKFKSYYYSFWKEMRKIKDIIAKGGAPKKTYKTKEEIQVVKMLTEMYNEKYPLDKLSILDIEDKYHERYGEETV